MKKTLLTLLAMTLLFASVYAAGTGKITLAWNASPSTNVVSYVLYGVGGTNTPFLTNNSNASIKVTNIVGLTYTVSNLVSGPYSFVVTARDAYNLESVNSNEAWTNVAPAAPITLKVTSSSPK